MVAVDFLQDPQAREWLDGVEPAWTLLTSESLRALRHEPSAAQTAIRIANDLAVGEIAGSPAARNTLILLRQAIERGGLPLTATGNLSRAVVAEMRKLIEWPDYDQADAFRFNKVINEPDFLPLHVVRQLALAATLVRTQRGKLIATPLGRSMLSDTKQGALLAILFHLAFWHICNRCVRFATTVASGHATLATKRTLLLNLGRTSTGWIAPACGWRTHSITSSARASSVGGTSRPSAFAVLRLMTNSNVVGN
jgi:hypothetical protein